MDHLDYGEPGLWIEVGGSLLFKLYDSGPFQIKPEVCTWPLDALSLLALFK